MNSPTSSVFERLSRPTHAAKSKTRTQHSGNRTLGYNSDTSGSKKAIPLRQAKSLNQAASIQSSETPASTRDVSKTCRATHIPQLYDKETLREALGVALGLSDASHIIVKSLARNCQKVAGDTFRTATLEGKILAQLSSQSENSENPSVQQASAPGEWKITLHHPISGQIHDIYIDINFNGFTPLSPLSDEELHKVDCIAIHGWGSHAFGGFKASKSSFMWLRDALPYDIPELRVWTYGYNYDLIQEKSVAGMDECAENFRHHLRDMREQAQASAKSLPLILIAHSLGGLILKQAFINMRSSTEYNDQAALECTLGLLFFGVPSQGMNTEALSAMVGNKFQRLDLARISVEIGHRLRNDHHRRFCDAFDFVDAKIFHFFETVKTPTVVKDPHTGQWSRTGPEVLLVSPDSATYGRSWENTNDFNISIESDHSGIIKFHPNDQSNYPKVRTVLKQLTDGATGMFHARQKALDETENAFLDSIGFQEMEHRVDSVSMPLANTFQWIWNKENQEFMKWLSDSETLFVIQGKPGSGKSTLLKHIMETRQTSASESHEIVVGFFFNDRGSVIESTMEGCLRSIIFQFLSQYRLGFRAIRDSRKKKPLVDTRVSRPVWEIEVLKNMLFSIIRAFSTATEHISKFNNVLIVVDALDECDKSFVHFKDLVNAILPLNQSSRRRVKVCCSTRPEMQRQYLSKFPGLALQDRNTSDIQIYVRKTARLSMPEAAVDDSSFVSLMNEIIEKADGIILWAKLVLGELLGRLGAGDTVSELRKVLVTIPEDLTNLFYRMAKKIDENYRLEGQSILRAVMCAQRQLRVEELQHAVAFGSERFVSEVAYRGSELVQHDVKKYEDRISSRCGGFVEVIQEPPWGPHAGHRIVRFIHQTVKTFIQENADGLFPDLPGSPLLAGHSFLLRACTQYLSLPDFKDLMIKVSESNRSMTTEGRLSMNRRELEHPFLTYATSHWIYHWKESDKLGYPASLLPEETQGYMNLCLPAWTFLQNAYAFGELEHLSTTSLLYLAVENDVQNFTQRNLKQKPNLDVDKPQGRYGCLMQAAAAKGHEAILQLLLDHGADVNNQRGFYGSPLNAATALGKDNMVRLLLDNNAEIRTASTLNTSKSTLEWALEHRHITTLKILLQRGAFSLGPPESQSAIISKAATLGAWDAVGLFLCHGANVNERCNKLKRPTLLHEAVRQGEALSIVQMLLEHGIDTEAKDDDGSTALHIAANTMRKGIAGLLMHTSGGLNAEDHDGWTPFHTLVRVPDEEVVRLALSFSPDVNKPDCEGWTPLHLAVSASNWNVVEILIDHGVDVNATTKDGWTALHLAADTQKFPAAGFKLLLKHGADPRLKTKQGWTPLHFAVDRGSVVAIETLSTASVNIDDESSIGWTALHVAASLGRIGIVEALMKLKPTLSKKTHDGYTALHLAAYGLQGPLYPQRIGYKNSIGWDVSSNSPAETQILHVIQALVEAGADMDCTTPDGWAPLHFAVKGNRLQAVKFFLSHGADVNVRNADLWTPLHLAVFGDDTNDAIIHRLLEHKADIEIASEDGWTVLHLAADGIRRNILELLLQTGSGIKHKDFIDRQTNDGLTALHIAAEGGKVGMVRLLLEHGAEAEIQDENQDLPLDLAVKGDHMGIFKLLRKDPNLTALHVAARSGFQRIVDRCIRRGIDINARDSNLWAALHIASHYGFDGIIGALLEQKANVNAPGPDGITPLHLAVESGYMSSVRLLLDNGADPGSQTSSGMAPLHYAAGDDEASIVLLLATALVERHKRIVRFLPNAISEAKQSGG